jgi:hypothetical protein
MQDLLFGDRALWFTVPAVAGTVFFVFRLLAMLAFGHGDWHVDDATSLDLDHADSSSAFKVLSVQAVAAFLMGFGWGGLGAYRGWGLPALASVPVGFAIGTGMMWLLGKLLRWIARLQSSGTMDTSAALHEEGIVYTAVPAPGGGRGVVRVVVDDRMRYYQAVSERDPLPSQTRVRVIGINADSSVTVTKIEELPT